MKLKKINGRGFAHDVLVVAFVVVFAVAGVAYLVGSHAASITPSSSWAFVGTASLPQQNETITAYGCKTVVSSTVWQVKGLFTLSNSYKNPKGFAWAASMINGSADPLKGFQSVYGNFPDNTSPAVLLKMNVDSQVGNPLSFSYSAGTPVKGGTSVAGNIVQNFYPDRFPTCGA